MQIFIFKSFRIIVFIFIGKNNQASSQKFRQLTNA